MVISWGPPDDQKVITSPTAAPVPYDHLRAAVLPSTPISGESRSKKDWVILIHPKSDEMFLGHKREEVNFMSFIPLPRERQNDNRDFSAAIIVTSDERFSIQYKKKQRGWVLKNSEGEQLKVLSHDQLSQLHVKRGEKFNVTGDSSKVKKIIVTKWQPPTLNDLDTLSDLKAKKLLKFRHRNETLSQI